MFMPPYFDYFRIKESMTSLIDHIKAITEYSNTLAQHSTEMNTKINELGKQIAQLNEFKRFAEQVHPGINDAFIAANHLSQSVKE